ncbi:MAG: hypothetical protein ACP5PS_05980, partial [Bacteroidales bacterium]
FKAALDNKVPIQPIVIDGSYIGLKKSKTDPSATIKVKILNPIPYEQFPSYNPSELKEHFRNLIQNELDKLAKS